MGSRALVSPLSPPSPFSTAWDDSKVRLLHFRRRIRPQTVFLHRGMRVAGVARRASRVFAAHLSLSIRCLPSPQHLIGCEAGSSCGHAPPSKCRSLGTLSLRNRYFSGISCGNGLIPVPSYQQGEWKHPNCLMTFTEHFCSGLKSVKGNPTVDAKELYGKMLDSVTVKQSAPPNAWLWSLIEKCENKDDIKLLFDILQRLRVFRLSNLRIHDNFNCNLCQEVTKACARVGDIESGKKALWKHNIYGLSPTIGSVNHLLSYAKRHQDPKLVVEIMRLLKRNDLPLQPSTADIVFSICYDTDKWELISKYSKRFLKAGVKLRKTTFDIWMEFAVKRGDTESLWEIEKLRSELYKQPSLKSGFLCAKGFLLEQKPENAAVAIQLLDQTLTDSKRPEIMVELQKLVHEWPSGVLKFQEEDQKASDAALKAGISTMISCLSNMGMAVSVNPENPTRTEPILS
ncbi:hypothetical protein Nepgr_020630 [Nepenthes gracilis]|uniref:Uncharacterized protein n=1 Tax=Nepenthes gracilis TaxID=150966 RepID=A0AAD3SXB3_NEPGR|nr:hypothetical protein Nepgr_020630 [Nepenthes gracilis]